MSAAQAPLTVQQIILFEHKQLMKDIAGFLAISLFITAVLIWAY
ncbi:hypothetical protein [Agrobacterium sp. lyk4-40-TYG-31]|nr:hypothetical protein [Agrobacterium sp. lyk4-40-TYG-31]